MAPSRLRCHPAGQWWLLLDWPPQTLVPRRTARRTEMGVDRASAARTIRPRPICTLMRRSASADVSSVVAGSATSRRSHSGTARKMPPTLCVDILAEPHYPCEMPLCNGTSSILNYRGSQSPRPPRARRPRRIGITMPPVLRAGRQRPNTTRMPETGSNWGRNSLTQCEACSARGLYAEEQGRTNLCLHNRGQQCQQEASVGWVQFCKDASLSPVRHRLVYAARSPA
jgi:hypothetical protein